MLQFFPKGKSRVAALQNPCCRPASYSMKDLRWAISSLSMPCDEKSYAAALPPCAMAIGVFFKWSLYGINRKTTYI